MARMKYLGRDEAFSLNLWINLPWWKLLPATSDWKFCSGYGILVFLPSLNRAYPYTCCASIPFTQSDILSLTYQTRKQSSTASTNKKDGGQIVKMPKELSFNYPQDPTQLVSDSHRVVGVHQLFCRAQTNLSQSRALFAHPRTSAKAAESNVQVIKIIQHIADMKTDSQF